MKNEIFTRMLEDIYAAHGKAFPAQKVSAAIFERVRELPDAFMAFAAEELRDYASLPQNPGRELRRVLWPLWMEKNPRYRARTDGRGCDNCRDSVAGPGFFFVREPDGHVVCLKCVCCEHDVSFARTWTLAEIYAAGLEPDLRNMSASRGDSGYAHEDARLPPEHRDMRPEAVSAGKVAESLGL